MIYLAVSRSTHFKAVGSSLTIFHFIQIVKLCIIYLTLWYFLFYWQKPKERVKGDFDVAISCYSHKNQIWRAANKKRINIISILINLQATCLEKQQDRGKQNQHLPASHLQQFALWQSTVLCYPLTLHTSLWRQLS